MTNENLSPVLRDGEIEFLYHLHACGAKYLVTGSHAVLLYAPDRRLGGANDLDVVVECSHENAVKVLAAAQACGYKPSDGEAKCIEGLSRPKGRLSFSYGGPIEILTSTDLPFGDLWRDRRFFPVAVVIPGSWRKSKFDAAFVSKAHLIQLKQEAIKDPARKEKRELDKIDLEDLRRSPYC
jgi:hypothetical protein